MVLGGRMKKIKKEDVINYSYKDIAFLIIENEKKGMNTLDLFKEIVDILDLPKSIIDNKIGEFYTTLTTDKRFVLVDGLWDLRTRHTIDKVIIKGLDEDEDEEENIDEEDEEDNLDEEDETSYETNDDADEYEEDDDDLSDFVVIDEDELDIENN